MATRKAVFLDRDGVLNELVYRPGQGSWDSPYTLDELRFLPGIGEAVRELGRAGFLTIVASNQPGVAKGSCDMGFLAELNVRLTRAAAVAGGSLDAIRYCLHHPQAVRREWKQACACRKPRPGLMLQAAQDFDIDLSASFLIGDRAVDVEAGLAAGCTPIFVASAERPEYAEQVARSFPAVRQCGNLREAATAVLATVAASRRAATPVV
jgi:D-glycero-D-manno-heptose 1,7-bisphosphate phosphatase